MNLEDCLLVDVSGSVVAPAGCGKTETIVMAVKRFSEKDSTKKILILTHTNAGVSAIRTRLKKHGVKPKNFKLDTIDGWSTRYVKSFPVSSGVDLEAEAHRKYDKVKQGMLSLIHKDYVRRIILSSYERVFVDEYQDCGMLQHKFFAALSDHLPCIVFGDPLQAIIDFDKSQAILSWKNDVKAAFPKLCSLTTPHRWIYEDGNKDLGKWLMAVRQSLISGEAIDLGQAPIDLIVRNSSVGYDSGHHKYARNLRGEGSKVVIVQQPAQEKSFAKSVGNGMYKTIEPIHSPSAIKKVGSFCELKSYLLINEIIGLASECMVNLSLSNAAKTNYSTDKLANITSATKKPNLYKALNRLALEYSYEDILLSMKELEHMGTFVKFDLWKTVREAILELSLVGTECKNSSEAVEKVRSRIKHFQRGLPHRLVSRTVLIKGLEFSEVLVVSPKEFELSGKPGSGARNFYVAITRSKTKLGIFSDNSTLKFTPPDNM